MTSIIENDTIKPDLLAVVDSTSQTAGCISWWRLSGELRLDALTKAWEAEGLDPKLLPKTVSPKSAMRRAVRSQSTKKRLLRSAPTGGWLLVDETFENQNQKDKPTYRTVASVKLGANKKSLDISPDTDTAVAVAICRSFEKHLEELSLRDVSTWLSKLVRHLAAVSLRDTGGFYFVPSEKVELYRKIAGVLRQVSEHKLYEIASMRSESAVEAILDSLIAEAEGEAEAMENELDNKDLGSRALKNRELACDALSSKLETYEQLLGRSLEAIRNRVESLKAGVVAASLAQAAPVGAN